MHGYDPFIDSYFLATLVAHRLFLVFAIKIRVSFLFVASLKIEVEKSFAEKIA
jgi:membrane-anchored protein YejM (alkaline phosphatase superfamily)